MGLKNDRQRQPTAWSTMTFKDNISHTTFVKHSEINKLCSIFLAFSIFSIMLLAMNDLTGANHRLYLWAVYYNDIFW